MSVPTTSWDENSPAGSDAINLGDNKIREMKTQIREVIDVDHDFPSSGSAADVGQHKKVTLQEQADLGTGAVNATILGSQTVSGKGELVYTDEDNNDIQITKSGVLKPSTSTVLADWAAIMNLVYPVGIVVTFGVSTNPATLLGVGTWTAIEGKVIVGKASAGTFNTLDATGGAETVTLDATMMPAHRHRATSQTSTTVSDNCDGFKSGNPGVGFGSPQFSPNQSVTWYDTDAQGNQLLENTGGGGAHNNLQPYIVKYVWQRTA